MRTVGIFLLVFFGLGLGISTLRAQGNNQGVTDRKVAALATDLSRVQGELMNDIQRVDDKSAPVAVGGVLSFLFGAFCALWAQNTNRSAWLWFIFGAIFSVVAVIILLIKNSNDRERARRRAVMKQRGQDR